MHNYFRIAKYNLFNDVVSTFLVLLTLTATFSLSTTLLIVIFNALRSTHLELQIITIYIIFLLIIFAITYINLYSLYKLSFLRREKYYAKLRIIGTTEKQLLNGIVLENLILSAITILISSLVVKSLISFLTYLSLNSLEILTFINLKHLTNSILLYLISSLLFVVMLVIVLHKIKKYSFSMIIIDALKDKKEFLKRKYIRDRSDNKNIINQYIYMNIMKRSKDISLITIAMILLFSILISSLIFFNTINSSLKSIETRVNNNDLLVKIKNQINDDISNEQRLEFINNINKISNVEDVISLRMNQVLVGMIVNGSDLKRNSGIKVQKNKAIISLNVLSVGDKKFKEISNNKDIVIINNYNGKDILKDNIKEIKICADNGSDYKNSKLDENKCSTYDKFLITKNDEYNYNWLDDNLTIIISDQLYDELHSKYNHFSETNIDDIDGVKYSEIYIKTNDIDKTIHEINNNNLGLNLEIENLYKTKKDLSNSKMALLVAIGILNALIVVSIIINLLNIMFNIVMYRKKEFKILKIFGLKNKDIIKMMFMETSYYLIKSILTGIIIGIIFGYLMCFFLKLFYSNSIFIFSVPILIIGILILLLLIFVYGVIFLMSGEIRKKSI